jgi:transposase
LFVLQQELQLYQMYQQQIAQCDQEIEAYLISLDSQIELEAIETAKKSPPTKKYSSNTPAFDLGSHLYRISGVDFTCIDGLGVLTVQTILSEVGLDPSRFPTVKHFTSWLGLCPGSRVSGGKVKSSQTPPVVNRAANSFRMAAHALGRSQTALGAFFRRLRARLATPKAITATAHKLARIFSCLWTSGGEYHDPGIDAYEQQYRQRTLKNLQRKADQLGFELVPLSNES